jgi:hypothetical protein
MSEADAKRDIGISQTNIKNTFVSVLLMQKRVLASTKYVSKIFLHQLQPMYITSCIGQNGCNKIFLWSVQLMLKYADANV